MGAQKFLHLENVEKRFPIPGKEDYIAVTDVDLDIKKNEIVSIIGHSGCGKSTLLRCFNRMNDFAIGSHVSQGSIHVLNQDIYQNNIDVTELRKKVGMVFQKPNPFPKSIFDNIAYGPRLHGLVNHKDDAERIVIDSLEKAGLYKEVKDFNFNNPLNNTELNYYNVTYDNYMEYFNRHETVSMYLMY